MNPEQNTPWSGRDALLGLIFFVLWLGAFGLIGSWLPDTGLVVVFGEAALLLPVWYLTIHKYKMGWADLGLRPFRARAIWLGCGLMLLSFFFNIGYAYFLARFNLQIQPDIDRMFAQTDYPWLLLFGGIVVAPFVEELFFRGFIFAALRRQWNWQKGMVASAALFALFHILPTSLLPIFILGLIFAFLYQVSGSLWPAILMHMLTNGLTLLTAYTISIKG